MSFGSALRGAAFLLLAAGLCGLAQPAAGKTWQYFRVGSAASVPVHPQAGYALMGGGTDLDEAFRWLCDRADGGDFLVVRAAGTNAYNPYLEKLCHLNSVATLVIPDRVAATDRSVIATITNASVIFIAGGDQARYINFWEGTPVEAALRDAVRRGVPVGGTSAGLAVLGQYIYSAQNDRPDDKDLTSEEALGDPFYRQVVIARDLLGIPILRGIVTDSHFDTRHREGRLLVFMARILETGREHRVRGIGVDEQTAVLVDPDGRARVVGKGEAEFLEADGKPRLCKSGRPLSLDRVADTPVHAGWEFDLKHWNQKASGPSLEVRDGQISLHPSL